MLLAGQLVLGFVLLVVGGELLVRGGGGLARALGLSPLVVGLTVVAAATSAPEFAVTLMATLGGSPGLAVGNVVGSNIANILLVLGVSALVLPLVVERPVLRVDLPVVTALGVLTLVLALDGSVSRLDGAALVLVLVVYMTRSVVVSRRAERAAAARESGGSGEALVTTHRGAGARGAQGSAALRGAGGATAVDRPDSDDSGRDAKRMLRDAVLLVVGVGLLVAGSQLLVSSASTIAARLGVSDLVIGLTVVAIGTSLPELATSVVAVARGQRDMAVGNVVGSCLFNLGGVLGLTGLLASGGVPVEASSRAVDLPVMIATVVVLWVLAFCSADLARRDGVLLLGGYVAYLAYLVLDATGSAVRDDFVRVVAVAGALVVVWLVVAVVREVRGRLRDG